MHGLSIILPLPSGSNTNLPRSLSTPTLPDLSRYQPNHDLSKNSSDGPPRSASFTTLPRFDFEYTVDEEYRPTTSTQAGREILEGEMQQSEQKKDMEGRDDRWIHRRNSLAIGTRLWIDKLKNRSEHQTTDKHLTTTPRTPTTTLPTLSVSSPSRTENKSRRVSESLTAFARKSWISPSRSQKMMRIDEPMNKQKLTHNSLSQQFSNTTTITTGSSNKLASENPSKSNKMSFLKILERPSSIFTGSATLNSSNSSASSSCRSSIDNRSTPRTSTDKLPPVSNNLSTEKIGDIEREPPRKRDELWSAFRALENDLSKFQSKSWSLKTNVVRASLIPFLRNHTGCNSIHNLRSEDLERRITVLNKWWTGLLEVLDGKHNQTVSGVDRPILLQGCYEIMIRPEWRFSLPVPGIEERTSSRSTLRISLAKRCPPSLASTSSLPFMIESVNQNIRDLFVQNLMQQISFVVEKMSLRYAPASLVTFCGKAAAYAFFFVPGVAEILVRIWRLPPDVLRRVSDELGISRRPNKLDFDDIVGSFPPHIQCLGLSSVKSISNLLRTPPSMPCTAKKIPWYGPWVARWCGRDSDLFFIFVKYFHILSEDFLASGLTLEQKARAPAQTLTVIDATIHRQPSSDLLPITFDDVLAGADESAAALPLPSNNSARLMAENRLIILLRDFLCENTPQNERARIGFGQVFAKMMQAAARKTSLFDYRACFILCDFMEEALNVFSRFPEASDMIDWYFWLDVCQRMLKSENTISEIRVFAFLYSVWNLVTADKRRKEVLSLEWLLTEEIFDKYFNHWCPMIRAYYMRLLCWRICRNDGESSDLDTQIFTLVSIRIKAIWAHYLYLKEQAELNNNLPPSTVPCLPAPGRRLLIIRNDNQSNTSPLFIGLDGIMSRNSSRRMTRNSSLNKPSIGEDYFNTPTAVNQNESETMCFTPHSNLINKRRSFVGKIISLSPFNFTSIGGPHSPTEIYPRMRSPYFRSSNNFHAESTEVSTKLRSHSNVEQNENEKRDWPPTTHRPFSFKFSLEYETYFEHGVNLSGGSSGGNGATDGSQVNTLNNISVIGSGLCERRLSPPRLPAPAQAWLSVKVPDVHRGITSKDWLIADNFTDLNLGNMEKLLPNDQKSSQPSPTTSLHRECLSVCQSAMTAKSNTNIKHDKTNINTVYKGRSLAEWSIVVGECNGFLERRRSEGVPNLMMVEVPTLGVEGLRRF